jgi:hypothetical protein
MGERDTAHEGIDFCYYWTDKGDIHRLQEKTKVPVIFAGQVVNICDDYLGKSVFIRHDLYFSTGSSLYTIYDHIKPDGHLNSGVKLTEGDISGILNNKRKNTGVIPHHIHISIAWIPDNLNPEKFGWQMLGDGKVVMLPDPLDTIKCPYSISSDI